MQQQWPRLSPVVEREFYFSMENELQSVYGAESGLRSLNLV